MPDQGSGYSSGSGLRLLGLLRIEVCTGIFRSVCHNKILKLPLCAGAVFELTNQIAQIGWLRMRGAASSNFVVTTDREVIKPGLISGLWTGLDSGLDWILDWSERVSLLDIFPSLSEGLSRL